MSVVQLVRFHAARAVGQVKSVRVEDGSQTIYTARGSSGQMWRAKGAAELTTPRSFWKLSDHLRVRFCELLLFHPRKKEMVSSKPKKWYGFSRGTWRHTSSIEMGETGADRIRQDGCSVLQHENLCGCRLRGFTGVPDGGGDLWRPTSPKDNVDDAWKQRWRTVFHPLLCVDVHTGALVDVLMCIEKHTSVIIVSVTMCV